MAKRRFLAQDSIQECSELRPDTVVLWLYSNLFLHKLKSLFKLHVAVYSIAES